MNKTKSEKTGFIPIIKTMGKSIREYKRPSILAPIFVMVEVVLECLINQKKQIKEYEKAFHNKIGICLDISHLSLITLLGLQGM